jgi:2-dehydro-3-deoxygalactonokinase
VTTPALIALDWGTTSLRAYLLAADGAVLEERAEPWGILRVPDGDFAAALGHVTREWRARWPALPAIASGMIGSAQGWVQAPYCRCPAGVDDLAAALVSAGGGVLRVVPGVTRAEGSDPPDVMRGEETQIVGALALHPALAERSLVILPGTHAKWVAVAGGRVRDFATYMTGELFAVLRDHSLLGRPARDAGAAPDPAEAEDAFARGVLAARDSAHGVAPLLFSARALVLAGRLAPAASLEYLSGLLVGDELRCGLASPLATPSGAGAPLPTLVGDPALCRRYAAALAVLGVPPPLVVEAAAPRGLWRIAERAGLVAAGAGPALRPPSA